MTRYNTKLTCGKLVRRAAGVRRLVEVRASL